MNTPIRVVIADDQPIIRDGFAAVLNSAPDITVVATAINGVQLVELVEQCTPDVVVADIRMPVLDGIAATAQISARTMVLMLTTFDIHDYVKDSLAAGARGFLLKDVEAPRLIEAVRAVASGSLILGKNVTDQLINEFAQGGVRQRSTPAKHGLTPREGEILALLAEGLSNAEIAGRLVISSETVKSHISEILRKLNLRDRVQAVVYAYREGLA